MDAAGLIAFPFADRRYMNDADLTVEMGVYRGHSSTLNAPAQYGLFLVLSSIDYIVQVYFPSQNMNAVISWRINRPNDGGVWTSWTAF